MSNLTQVAFGDAVRRIRHSRDDLERRIDRALARRDFLEANRLIELRRVGEDDPICKGGQGRSSDDVERDGGMVLMLVCAAICGAVAWMFVDGAIALFGGGR